LPFARRRQEGKPHRRDHSLSQGRVYPDSCSSDRQTAGTIQLAAINKGASSKTAIGCMQPKNPHELEFARRGLRYPYQQHRANLLESCKGASAGPTPRQAAKSHLARMVLLFTTPRLHRPKVPQFLMEFQHRFNSVPPIVCTCTIGRMTRRLKYNRLQTYI